MKRPTQKFRERAVTISLLHRSNPSRRKKIKGEKQSARYVSTHREWEKVNSWIRRAGSQGLNYSFESKRKVILTLPKILNFSDMYDSTILYIHAIRKLVGNSGSPRKAYKLALVNFDNVKKISTSAALVLTAELSKWEDKIRRRLVPRIQNWDRKIVSQLLELGFFDLFDDSQVSNQVWGPNQLPDVNLIKYIKGRCGDNDKIRELKEKMLLLVNRPEISKWTFLASGLSEAITNVTHHAYPEGHNYAERDKNWYLGGSYNNSTGEIRIVFYDQGISIPGSLPSSKVWERILAALSAIPAAEQMKHEVMLRAAVEINRTRTHESDRGKGLQDMLEFVRQRKDGYLAILSGKGLYKFTMEDGVEHTKTERFSRSIEGTLIIWKCRL